MDDAFFVISALCGVVFALAGILLWRFPPKKINGIYGYRTPSSMKNQERWDFAQKEAAKGLIAIGLVETLLSFTSFIWKMEEKAGVMWGLLVLFVLVVSLLIWVERKIKLRFGG